MEALQKLLIFCKLKLRFILRYHQSFAMSAIFLQSTRLTRMFCLSRPVRICIEEAAEKSAEREMARWEKF